jgi:hypothetical protein
MYGVPGTPARFGVDQARCPTRKGRVPRTGIPVYELKKRPSASAAQPLRPASRVLPADDRGLFEAPDGCEDAIEPISHSQIAEHQGLRSRGLSGSGRGAPLTGGSAA